MTIPLATTSVTVTAESEPEPGDGVVTSTRARRVRAVVGAPVGNEVAAPGGGAERVDAVLNADPIRGLAHTDRVTDHQTGDVYEVRWVTQRHGLGLDHTRAGLVRVSGRTAG